MSTVERIQQNKAISVLRQHNYGQIHVCVRELVEEKFGADAWKTVLETSGLDENDHFMVFHKYDDPTTFKLIGAVCEVLGVELPTVLEIFGEYFLTYCLRHGYDKMLKTLGSNFKSFIQNLDSLHSLLALTYKNIVAPSFRCETNEDNSLALHYYTVRPGLYPIVLGLVKAVARDLYNQSAEISVVNINQELLEEDKIQEHVTFKVTLNDMHEETKSLTEFRPSFPSEFHISAEQFCRVFPYHVIFDSDLRIKQCGTTIQRQLRRSVTNEHISDIFELVHPRIAMAVINFRMFINAVFMMKIKPSSVKYSKNGKTSNQGLTLKGQMMWLEDTKHMIFISSPRLSSLTELMEMDVYLADIPLYDVTRELVLLNQQRIAEIDIAKQLDETTIELRKISKALEAEKQKTDELLYQMLPERVANDLKNGKTIEAEKFEQVTILFSDIVTFTNIAAACSAMDVVDMLNDLYHRFDTSTNAHGVYKVETIGDAYMIVCGVPIKTPHHAKPVANFAMDMVTEASQVMSPATGKPLQIRIGVHSGPVVAGVVGKKMPRYCLFGDTVNTASRMESHGVPGRIHVSPTTYRCLNEMDGFKFRYRGEIGIKGKGQMTTFFLVGATDRCLVEPNDDYLTLPLVEDMKVKPRIINPKITKQSSAAKLRGLGSPQISLDTESGDRSTNSEPKLVHVIQQVMNGDVTETSDSDMRSKTDILISDANDKLATSDVQAVICDNITESNVTAINGTEDKQNEDTGTTVINENGLDTVNSRKTSGFEDKRDQLMGERNQTRSVERAISGLCTVL